MDSKEKKQLAKQRKETARQAQKFHKEQEKQNKKSSAKSGKTDGSKSKIKEAVNARRRKRRQERPEYLSREEKYLIEGEEKLRNLQPQDHEDGYFVDEYAEKQRQEKRAKQIRKQENEVIYRNKKPLTRKQIRIKRILISSAIFAAVLIIGVILSLTVLFKTEKIEVEGDIYYDKDQIISFSNVAPQQNIFIGSWNSTPKDIVNNLPYVEDAKISFSIPDTITIKVTNAVPTYAVKDGSTYLIVSSKGRILETEGNKTEDLVELKCGEIKNKKKGEYIDLGGDSVYEILHSVAKSFADNGIDKVTGFDITSLSEITINYDNRIDINIGLPEDIDYKIKTAFTIINEKLDPNKTGTVTGTLDVSTCNKNKISHYKPNPTTAPTVPATTAPVTTPDYGDTYDNGGYYDDGTYDNGGYYDNGNTYDNGGYYDDGNTYDGGYDNGGYDNGNTYDDGGTGYDNGGDQNYDWQPE